MGQIAPAGMKKVSNSQSNVQTNVNGKKTSSSTGGAAGMGSVDSAGIKSAVDEFVSGITASATSGDAKTATAGLGNKINALVQKLLGAAGVGGGATPTGL